MAVPVTAVVDYDIEKLRIKMKEDYNFLEDMVDQINSQFSFTRRSKVWPFSDGLNIPFYVLIWREIKLHSSSVDHND